MKKLALIFVLILLAMVSFGQTDKTVQEPKTKNVNKEETVKTVPKSTQKKAQIKKTQVKKTQMQNKKKKQIMRKAKTVRRRKNG